MRKHGWIWQQHRRGDMKAIQKISMALAATMAALGANGVLAQGAKQVADTESTVRVGWQGPAITLDPHKQLTITFPHTYLFYDRLTTMDVAGQTVLPMLATKWSFSKDGKNLTMTLRGTPSSTTARR